MEINELSTRHDEIRRAKIEVASHDYGDYIYVPTTLRALESVGALLNSSFGADDDEHAELLDDPNILRIAVDISYDGATSPNHPDIDAVVEVWDSALWGNAGWHRATPLPTEIYGGGEASLREANQTLIADSQALCALAQQAPGFDAAKIECAESWGEFFGSGDCDWFEDEDE